MGTVSRGTVSAHGQAWSTSLLRYVDLVVDASGNLLVSGSGDGGTVAQGAPGATAWPVILKDDAGVSVGPATEATLALIKTDAGHFTVALDFDGSGNPIYIGKAAQGSAKSAAVWQIRKLTFDGSNNPTDIQYANGSTAFNAIWNNRASLSYS